MGHLKNFLKLLHGHNLESIASQWVLKESLISSLFCVNIILVYYIKILGNFHYDGRQLKHLVSSIDDMSCSRHNDIKEKENPLSLFENCSNHNWLFHMISMFLFGPLFYNSMIINHMVSHVFWKKTH